MLATDVLRRVRFQPYRRGMGPTFALTTWDTNRTGFGGKYMIGYRLKMAEPHRCERTQQTTCGRCNRSWCDACDPTPSALCHWCHGRGESTAPMTKRTVLFEGEGFGCSPMHAIDSDETIAGVMAFLTLRPGDTDPEYFANYTPEQLAYCSEHAEALSCEVERRFPGN